ncbi:hypothetical protein ACIBEJ_34695 [Nonomuraea sp. NPDC050790]|uniref:hypothetical protein n=1 Tax=Nonomuraea sp. NPDC050790 TaxID=3364371 RepID=UPI0037A54685
MSNYPTSLDLDDLEHAYSIASDPNSPPFIADPLSKVVWVAVPRLLAELRALRERSASS